MALNSLPLGYRAAVFGASGGLGEAFLQAFLADSRCSRVYAVSRRKLMIRDDRVTPLRFELEDASSIEDAAVCIQTDGPLHIAVVATGVLHAASMHPEKTWRALQSENLSKAFALNAIGPALIAKHVLPLLSRTNKAVFAALSARVGSIADNRLGGWHAYRASKAALNMLVRNFAVELARTNPAAVCVALHPGTVATALSRPFLSSYTQAVTPEEAVRRLLHVIDNLARSHSGQLIDWNGEIISP